MNPGENKSAANSRAPPSTLICEQRPQLKRRSRARDYRGLFTSALETRGGPELNRQLTCSRRYWCASRGRALADPLYFGFFAILALNALVIILALAHAMNGLHSGDHN